ncbi:hypothetical protein KKG52_01165 [Patescibacteria group bacterium]|nr:hypothetical protein [Patescibacteria group bacterium]
MKKLKINKWFIKPLFLLLLWGILTTWYIAKYDTALSVISIPYFRSNLIEAPKEKIIKGDKISGKFKASENGLGIISVKFITYNRPKFTDEDELLFRIKEENNKDWHYESKYKNGLMYDVPHYPFGFPVIQNSKNKTYIFEVISTKGNSKNTVSLSKREPGFEAKYKFSKNELLSDKWVFLDFGIKKIGYSLFTPDVLYASLVFLLPLLFYILWNSTIKKYVIAPLSNKALKFTGLDIPTLKNLLKDFAYFAILNILIIFVLIDVFYLQLISDLVYIIIPILWGIYTKKYKLDSRASFAVGLFFIALCPIILIFNQTFTAEKSASWAFMFLIVGTIQALIELRKEEVAIIKK